jgi:hypothetical protein
MRAEFRAPLFVGSPYDLTVNELSSSCAQAEIVGDGKPLLFVEFEFMGGPTGRDRVAERPGRLRPRRWNAQSLAALPTVKGAYGPSARPLRSLVERWHLKEHLSPAQSAVLLWASYFVGMVLPGKQAILASINVRFNAGISASGLPLIYVSRVQRFDRRFGLLSMEATLSWGHHGLARVDLKALVRQDPTALL